MKIVIYLIIYTFLLNKVRANEVENLKPFIIEYIKTFIPLTPIQISWKRASFQSRQILARFLSKNDLLSFFENEFSNRFGFIISNDIEDEMERKNININQGIYFINENTTEIWEKYDINGMIIKNKLGKFSNSRLRFKDGIDKSLLKRRSNFHGINLKVMTEETVPFVKFSNDYLQKAMYFGVNETYDVTSHSR